jgi:hypothetical protein
MAVRVLKDREIAQLFADAIARHGLDSRAYEYDADLMCVKVYAVMEKSMRSISLWYGDSHPASARLAGQMELQF